MAPFCLPKTRRTAGSGNGNGNGGKRILDGGAGADRLHGGAGADQLTGGSGADVFVFTPAAGSTARGYDTVLDFLRGTDKLDFARFDANAARSGQQDFSCIGKAAFGSNATGQPRYQVSGADVMLYGSTDADATAEFAVKISGASALSASDFLF